MMRRGQRVSIIYIALVISAIFVLYFTGILLPIERGLRVLVFTPTKWIYEHLYLQLADNEAAGEEGLIVDETKLKLLQEENRELRAALHYKAALRYAVVGAEVVGRGSDPLRQTRLINQGRSAGVEMGQPVVVGNGILVGKIGEVNEESALVYLLTDHRSRVATALLNQDRTLGVIEGGYGISMRMNLIPQNEVVPVGETAITSGLEPLVPRGLLIGKIETVEKEAYQPFQRASITPLANGEKIRLVSILVSSSTTPVYAR